MTHHNNKKPSKKFLQGVVAAIYLNRGTLLDFVPDTDEAARQANHSRNSPHN